MAEADGFVSVMGSWFEPHDPDSPVVWFDSAGDDCLSVDSSPIAPDREMIGSDFVGGDETT